MESLDLRVLGDVLAWRGLGHAVTLVTVIETWGSAPRPPGALLAVRDDGVVSGSVSGGCVEDDLITRTRDGFNRVAAGEPALVRPALIVYGASKEETARFGLPCGGTMRLVQEPVLDTAWVAQLLARTADHQLVARRLTLATGVVQLSCAERGQHTSFDGSILTTIFGPQWRLLLIGAGQLSQAVAQMAIMLDFEVLVCDPREEYAVTMAAGVPASQRVAGMPDEAVRTLMPDAHTAIVALTHDPKLDDMALIEALQSQAFYVGALGSRRNQDARRQRLAKHFDLSTPELARLHGPVGLSLGAKTPAEIAVSIMAEIIQIKNSVSACVLIAKNTGVAAGAAMI